MTTFVSQAEFARMEGKARSYITALKVSGRLVMEGDKVNVEASRERIAATADPEKHDVKARWEERRAAANMQSEPQQTEKIGGSYQAARAVKEKYAAMQAKLDYEMSIKTVVTRDAVAYKAAEIGALLRTNLERLPDVLAPQLAEEKNEAEIRILLCDYINSELRELSDRLNEIAGLES